jgi:hypothetical protein
VFGLLFHLRPAYDDQDLRVRDLVTSIFEKFNRRLSSRARSCPLVGDPWHPSCRTHQNSDNIKDHFSIPTQETM